MPLHAGSYSQQDTRSGQSGQPAPGLCWLAAVTPSDTQQAVLLWASCCGVITQHSTKHSTAQHSEVSAAVNVSCLIVDTRPLISGSLWQLTGCGSMEPQQLLLLVVGLAVLGPFGLIGALLLIAIGSVVAHVVGALAWVCLVVGGVALAGQLMLEHWGVLLTGVVVVLAIMVAVGALMEAVDPQPATNANPPAKASQDQALVRAGSSGAQALVHVNVDGRRAANVVHVDGRQGQTLVHVQGGNGRGTVVIHY